MLDVQRIIAFITEKGLNCSSVEKALGFGNGSIRRWETSSPSISKLYELSNFLNIPLEQLLSEEEHLPSKLTSEQQELLTLWSKLDPIKQAEFKGELKGYIKAKEEK